MDWFAWATLIAILATAVLNHRAHNGISTRIDGLEGRLGTRIDGLEGRLGKIASEVTFMAGRQRERDQHPPAR